MIVKIKGLNYIKYYGYMTLFYNLWKRLLFIYFFFLKDLSRLYDVAKTARLTGPAHVP